MLTNKVSFDTPRKLWEYVTKYSDFPIEQLENVDASPECIDFIQKAMTASPRRRLTSEDGLKHAWFVDHEFVDSTKSDCSSTAR